MKFLSEAQIWLSHKNHYNTFLVIQRKAEQLKFLMYWYSLKLHITDSSMFIIPTYSSCNVSLCIQN